MRRIPVRWTFPLFLFVAGAVSSAFAGAALAADAVPATSLDKARVAAKAAADENVAAAKTAAEKAAAAKTAADQAAAAQAAASKTAAEKIAAEKAAKEAADTAAAANRALAEKDAAAKTAVQTAAAAKAAADKAAAEKAAVDKVAAEKAAAAKAAADRVASEEAYHALIAIDQIVAEKTAAEKVVAQNLAAVNSAAAQLAAAQAAAAKATAEKTAAEKTLSAAVDAEKPNLQKALDAKVAAEKAAVAQVTAAQAAADKAAAESRAAQQVVTDKEAARRVARDKAAVAQAAVQGGLKPLAASAWDYAKARHLIVRAGFGGTPEEVQKLYEMGLHDAVDYMVDIYDRPAANIEFDPLRLERPEPWESRLEEAERTVLSNKRINRERVQQAELRRWWLRRMAESPRPLQEKLTLFWHDHFAVQYEKDYRTYRLYQQNELFRTYGCCNFGALLHGTVHDPAMIAYLDNHVNFKGSGNENLGREILELFSMGEGQGYTEEDLREASRALTGYNYDYYTEQFRFLATRHDETTKTIFGRKGNWGGDDLVDLILQQPATARYVTLKLCEFLIHETPDPATVDQLAHVMRTCGYDLRPMLKNLFLSQYFYSEKAMGTHIKGPVELAIGTIRDLGLKDVNYAIVDSAVTQMGQYLFEPPNVAGWNEHRTWINAERILVRYNQIANLLEQRNVDVVGLLQGKGLQTPDQIVDYLAKACLVVSFDEKKRKALVDYLGELPPAAQWDAKREAVNAKLRAIVVLLMSTPESQLG